MAFPEEQIEEYDNDNILSDILGLHDQLLNGYELAKDVQVEEFSNVVMLGMGGSSIAAQFLRTYLKKIPLIVENDYILPREASKESLIIAVSYSGNTEETISAYRQALRMGCKVIVLSTGGRMKEMARVHRSQFVELPTGLQPRASIGYQFTALLRIMEIAGLVKDIKKELTKAAKALKKDVFTKPALNLSDKLYKVIPIIYSSKDFYPVAYRWRTQLNENSKVLAISNYFSEHNHNEILGFINSNYQGKFHVVMLSTQDDHPKIKKRMSLVKQSIQKNGVEVTEIGIKGNSALTRMLSASLIGDLTSYYLALRYQTDPSVIPDINWLKEKLK